MHASESSGTVAAPSSATRWYVIKCKHRQEYRAREHLERQNYSCYLPELDVEILNRHGKQIAKEPLFPGYLFVNLNNLEHSWHPIRSTRGVSHIVRFSEDPTAVADELVEAIRNRIETDRPKVPYLQPGERVRVVEGSFSHLEAIFLANDGDQRVLLLMTILHQEHRLSFPVAAVRRCSSY